MRVSSALALLGGRSTDPRCVRRRGVVVRTAATSFDTGQLGNTGSGTDAVRHRPRHARRRPEGRRHHGADQHRSHHDHRPGRGLLPRHDVGRRPAAHPVAHPVQVRPGQEADGAGARPGDGPRAAQRRLHQVDVHDPPRREVRGRDGRHREGHRVGHAAVHGRRDVPDRPLPVLLERLLPRWLQVQRSLHGARPEVQRRQGQRQQADDLHGQALPRHAVLGRLPGQRPGASGQGLRPDDVQEAPVVDRPLHDQDVQRVQGAGSDENPYWDPKTDPARTQYPDGYDFRAPAAVGEDRPDPARGLR